MKRFLQSNDLWARLGRSILQGIIGVIIANIDLIVGSFQIMPEWKGIIVALTMCTLSPIMKALGGNENDYHADNQT